MSERFDFEKFSTHCSAEESPGFLLWRVSTSWRRAIEEVLKPLSLTHPQFVILATVGYLTRTGEKVSQAEIGRHAGLDPNTTSQILRGLQTKKLVKRAQATDERSKCPILTALGARRLAKALPAVEQADAQFFSIVNLRETKFLDSLQKLSRN